MRKWLLAWLLKSTKTDVRILIQDELKLVQDALDIENMDIDARLYILSQSHQLNENQVLQQILDTIIMEQKTLTVNQAETLEQLWAGRANIAGVKLVRDELNRLNNLWLSAQKPEEFDKYSLTQDI